jgi:hypothetical protein
MQFRDESVNLPNAKLYGGSNQPTFDICLDRSLHRPFCGVSLLMITLYEKICDIGFTQENPAAAAASQSLHARCIMHDLKLHPHPRAKCAVAFGGQNVFVLQRIHWRFDVTAQPTVVSDQTAHFTWHTVGSRTAAGAWRSCDECRKPMRAGSLKKYDQHLLANDDV